MEREVNQGWKQQDQWYLNRYDNAQADPELQILTEDTWEDENLEQRYYFCAICKSRLDFLKGTESIWQCSNCSQIYDTSIQDVPVKNIGESKVRVSAELQHYPTYEENDIWSPFIEAINADTDSDEDIPSNVVVVSDDRHRKHIRVKGDITKALSAMNEMDGKAE